MEPPSQQHPSPKTLPTAAITTALENTNPPTNTQKCQANAHHGEERTRELPEEEQTGGKSESP